MILKKIEHFLRNATKDWPEKRKRFEQSQPFVSKWILPVLGLLSLIWFIVRIIPKPSRAGYPCMKVAAPLASGFVLWFSGLTISAFAYTRARRYLRDSRYIVGALLIIVALVGGLIVSSAPDQDVVAKLSDTQDPYGTINPVGTAKGIFPGRVVWVHNPDATNENVDWSDLPRRASSDVWYDDNNNDQDVIDQMFSDGIQNLSGQTSDQAAWDAIFKYFNKNHNKGEVGYKTGEIVFLKTNSTSTWSGNINNTMDDVKNNYYGMSETSPHLILTVLRNLVNVVGVPQEDIYVGDPMKHIYTHIFDKLSAEFPNVHYLDNNSTYGGRERVKKSTKPRIFYSDNGKVIQTGTWGGNPYQPIASDGVYTIFEDAEYVMNIPTLKGHKHAGVTMFAKNNFGSHTRGDASHLHPGLVDPSGTHPAIAPRNDYGVYRVLVDLMGHELLGGKMLFYLLDALWASDYENDQPDKFQVFPFLNDWTSSLLFSLDPVAIESVGYDILKEEFHSGNYPNSSGNDNSGITFYPQMGAVDDYLHQAAHSSNWPQDVFYDPEGDGTYLPSLGVHEHWNNSFEMKYSRNLGTGDGIELVYQRQSTLVEDVANAGIPADFALHANYPNPFNPSTTIRYEVSQPSAVELSIFNIYGQKIKTLVSANQSAGVYETKWDGKLSDGMAAASGIYLYRLNAKGASHNVVTSRQMLLMK